MIDMDKGNLNKLVTNYPVELTPEEVENLSQTLSSVRTAREDDKTYTGEGFVNVNNTNNVISLTNEANEKLNQPIPTKVSDLTDSANYQTVSGMDEYLTKTSASENLAPLSITDDIESLKNASSDWNKVSAKLDTTAFSTVSGNYAFKNDLNDYYQKTETSSKGELDIAFESKQDKLIFGYDENNSISSINNTALAGQDVTTYSAGQYIEIDENNTISVTGLMPLNEYAQYEPVLIGDSNITATSSKVDSHTQWNLAINSKPVITDTKLVGENSITAHTTNVSGEWVVGLEESAHNSIASVAGIATDVVTLKTASAGWDKVSAKLDVTSFSTVSGTFLTEIPDTYATKNDLNIASSTLTSIDNDLSGHIDYVSAHSITSLDDYYTKTQVDSTFALKTEIPTTVTQLTDSGNYYQKTETSSKTEITNALNTKVDNPSQQTGLLVYDGDISAWVSMPPDTTIVQGQGSITSNYESNSTYTVSLLASAENALKKVVNKIDTTAVEQKYQTKDDMSNYLTTSEASTTYQPIGDYATTSDISDMATQTWVGQQGFYTKASADNDYAPKTITATVNTLTGASASWNEVSAISSIESVLENKKDKQNELNFNGSATKTVKKITQYPNGEMNVEFEDIDLPQEVPNVDITSVDNSVNITSSVDAGTNTKTFDLSVNIEDAPTFGRFVANNGLTLTKTEGNMTLSSDGKIQLKKGKGYHFTIRGNYYNDTLYNDLRDISFIEYSRNETIPIIVDGTLSTSQAQPFEISFDVAQRTSDLNYGIAFSGLTSNGHITGLVVEVHDINSVSVNGGGGGSGTTYSAGDGIDLTNDTISVKYGKGLELNNNELQVKVESPLTVHNNAIGFIDAPIDDYSYVRNNGAWVPLPTATNNLIKRPSIISNKEEVYFVNNNSRFTYLKNKEISYPYYGTNADVPCCIELQSQVDLSKASNKIRIGLSEIELPKKVINIACAPDSVFALATNDNVEFTIYRVDIATLEIVNIYDLNQLTGAVYNINYSNGKLLFIANKDNIRSVVDLFSSEVLYQDNKGIFCATILNDNLLVFYESYFLNVNTGLRTPFTNGYVRFTLKDRYFYNNSYTLYRITDTFSIESVATDVHGISYSSSRDELLYVTSSKLVIIDKDNNLTSYEYNSTGDIADNVFSGINSIIGAYGTVMFNAVS